jgi:toxin HigB-1
VIRSFADKDSEELFLSGQSRKFSKAVCKTGVRKLDYLNAATTLEDMKAPPGNRLEALKGKYKGKYSIRINDQYRIVFRFKESDAYEVEIADYH